MLRGRWIPVVSALVMLGAPVAGAVTAPPLSAEGTFFRPDHPGLPIGPGTGIEEIAAFVQPAGAASPAELSVAAVPAGLSLAFSHQVSADGTDLRLRYDFTNTGAATLASLSFLSFLDLEIDEPTTTFFNEFVEVDGTAAAGQGYEADEPGYVFGDIFTHAQAGALDGTNAVPAGSPDDVSVAFSFLLGALAPGQTARFEILISEDGESLGGLLLRHRDTRSDLVVTYSGAASIVPEPGTALLLAAGLVALAQQARREGARRRR